MAPNRRINRRSFFARVTGGGALLLSVGRAGAAQTSDSDPTDPIGHGHGNGGTGYSDSDSGANADPAGHGRGGNRPSGGGATGVTDSDSGAGADPAGHGRGGGGRPSASGSSGVSDNDSGPQADPGGHGRGVGRPVQADRGENCAQLRREQEALTETLGQFPYNWSEEDIDGARGDLGIVQARLARINEDLAKTDGGLERDRLIWEGGSEIYARIQRWIREDDLRGLGNCGANLPTACVDMFAHQINVASAQQGRKRQMQVRLETVNEMIGNYCG